MSNFAALDPTLPRKGMGNYSKSDAELWEEFFEAPSSFLEKAAVYIQKPSTTSNFSYPEGKDVYKGYEVREGQDVKRLVKTRTNQGFFRDMMLASYNGQCAATKISQTDLLIASHIKPWSKDKEARLDPRNGILLNALHDRAFEHGFITFDNDLNLIRSRDFDLPEMAQAFFADVQLSKPERFAPDPVFLEHHRTYKFIDSPHANI